MKASNANKVISVLLSVAMCPMMVPSAAFAADDDAASGASSPSEQTQPADQAEGVDVGASLNDTIAPQSEATGEAADEAAGEAAPAAAATVNGYPTLEEAVQNATVDAQGAITYEVTGKVNVGSTGWVQVRPATATNAKVVKFVGKSDDAEICITQGAAILADQENSALSVEFNNLTLSKLNPEWAQDFGHSTNYFTTWLRNADAASNCVTYTDCEFPNGVCNNQYGKTVFDNCTFTNTVTKLYNMWVYGGNVEVKGGSFTGVRGVKVYTEGTATVAPKVDITGASFTGISEKAAIVVSKPATVTLSNVSATTCAKGLIQKAIGNSEKVTLDANGTGVGGKFDITENTGSDATKAEFNLNAGTLTSEVSSDFLADGFTLNDNGDGTFGVAEAAPAGVAEVNDKSYPSLQDAIDAAPRKATVKLLADTYENVTISANAITLDLNGHTLNGGTVKAKPALTINNTRVTVQDSSEAQTGTIMREDTAENSGVSSHYVIDVQGRSGFLLFNGGTVKNNSGTANGAKGASLIRVGNNSNKKAHPTVTIAGGTFTQDNFIAIKVDFGTLYVKGGVVNSKNSYAIENWLNANIKDNAVINGNVSSWTYAEGSNSNLNISGGTVNGNVESVTYDGAEGKTAKVSITGGTVNGTLSASKYNSTEINDPTKATIEVTGGTFSTDPSRYLVEGSAATQNADGTYGVEKAYLAQVGETSYYTMDEAFKAQTASGEAITLLRDYTTGGTFEAAAAKNGHSYVLNAKDGSGCTIEVKGGTFKNFDPSNNISEGEGTNFVASGYAVTAVENGSDTLYTVSQAVAQVGTKAFASLQAAIDAAQDGETVTLLTDVEQNSQLTIGKSITLDLNGKTIKNTQDIWGDNAVAILSITNGAKVTITGNGTMDAKENDCYTINVKKGDLTIENGTFYGNVSVVQVQEGTLSVKGGIFDLHQKWEGSSKYLFNCIDDAYAGGSANVAISGGTFVGFDPSASPEGEGTSYLAPGYAPTDNGDGTYGVVAGVAQIGTKAYATLAGAVAAAQDGDTITLLSDCSGDGISIKDDTFPNGLTIDFAGHSYTVGGKLVGSSGTASNGFHLLKGNTIVMRNGSIYGDASVAGDDTTQWSGSPAIMIQNYSNLTLDGMTVKGGKQTCYTLSNNNGDTVIKDSTIIAGQNTQVGGPFAFDVCRYASYPSVSVTVEGNSVIDGCVDVSGAIGEGQNRQLTITGGTFSKPISVSTQPANIAISGGTFATEIPAEHCAAGYAPTANADGTYGVKLAEGAYLLQDYRSGDQASWTYPAKEGMAFAGWYKDAALTTPCTANDVEGAAYAKFVNITDLLQFRGGSLRMDKGDPTGLTYLRFGYTMAIPGGTTYIQNGWYYKKVTVSSPDDVRFVAYNNVLNSDGSITSNLVFPNVKKSLYSATFTEKAFVKYQTADGTTVEAVEGAYQTRSVNEVAEMILSHPMASQTEKEYATKIKSAS